MGDGDGDGDGVKVGVESTEMEIGMDVMVGLMAVFGDDDRDGDGDGTCPIPHQEIQRVTQESTFRFNPLNGKEIRKKESKKEVGRLLCWHTHAHVFFCRSPSVHIFHVDISLLLSSLSMVISW